MVRMVDTSGGGHKDATAWRRIAAVSTVSTIRAHGRRTRYRRGAWMQPMFGFLKRRRRRRILAQPFPAEWQAMLHREVWQYRLLSREERSRLRDAIRIFVAERKWEGARDFPVTEEMKLIIASQACLLALNVPECEYARVHRIVVLPDAYDVAEHRTGGSIVQTGFRAAGQAETWGPVVLSWRDVRRGIQHTSDGRNVVLHEFAHKLDMRDGIVNGTPRLGDPGAYERWHRVMTEEFERLQQAIGLGLRTALRSYGATNPGEFFAVATECFFERSIELREEHPELYEVLSEFYRQDPAERLERAMRSSGESW
jgi:Mlc titration factor MtfA (ptsG expression regulator)